MARKKTLFVLSYLRSLPKTLAHKKTMKMKFWSEKIYYIPTYFPRYGDRSPKAIPARVFAIVWILIGLVIISITTGVIATSLTAITLSTDLQLYGAKVRVLHYLKHLNYRCK